MSTYTHISIYIRAFAVLLALCAPPLTKTAGAATPSDPEAHYLKGEALYAQGREDEARREHEIAEHEIGQAPRERMPKLWLARIHARRGEMAAADAIYESLWPASPAVDVEASVNHAEAHILNRDWSGARRLLERLLARDSKNVRAREVLAWVLEVTGDLDHELPVRAGLASDQPTSANWRDQGRALERAGEFRAAYASYQSARAARAVSNDPQDETLTTSLSRMRYRITPEVAGGFLLRRDPSVDSFRGQAGLALSLGSRHSLSFVGWHENSWGNVSRAGSLVSGGGDVTGLGTGLLIAGRRGELLILGGDLRYASTNRARQNQDLRAQTTATRVGASAEGALPFLGHAELQLRGDLDEQWNDAAVTVSEGGTVSGASGQLFLFPTNRRFLLSLGAQQRWLRINSEYDSEDPTSIQKLLFGGIDLVLWSRPSSLLRGEVLDEKMARRSYLSDAAILSYRHQHLWGHSSIDFSRRLVLADEAATHVGSAVVRKVFLNGRLGIDGRGALGYDTKNAVTLYSGSAAFVVTPSWSTRLSVSYDVTKETASGFGGIRHAGWISFHADI